MTTKNKRTKTTTGFLYKRGETWWARWQYQGKSERKTTGETDKRKAKAKLKELIAPFALRNQAETLAAIQNKIDATETAIARIEDERNPPPKVSELWQAYRDAPNRPDIGAATLRQYECQVERFATWAAENAEDAKTIRDVTPAIAEQFMAYLAKGKASANTFNKYVALFRLVWRILKDRAQLDVDPWEHIARRRLVTVSKRDLTVEELRTVCRAAKGEMQALFAIGLFSGLRLGDAATLKWNEVDLERGIILRVTNKTARRHTPKTVTVPLVPELRTILATLKASQSGENVLPVTARRAVEDYRGLIRSIQKFFTDCGITTHGEKNGERKRAPVVVGFHSLRHSFVSICRMAGVPLVVVESIVGHSNPAMTRNYSHVGIEASVRAVSTMPTIMTDAPALPETSKELPTLASIRAMIESQNAKNWRTVRTQLLGLLPS